LRASYSWEKGEREKEREMEAGGKGTVLFWWCPRSKVIDKEE